MSALIDMTGQRFGRWTVVRFDPTARVSSWLCRCDCGTVKTVQSANLRQGVTNSCGCLNAELASQRNSTHRQCWTPTYRSWVNMTRRCRDKKLVRYERYGGRGIKVCARWLGKNGFTNFLADMGERPQGMSIDRYPNPDGDYEPSNCRWATPQQQQTNKHPAKNAALLTFRGQTKMMSVWARELGMSQTAFARRLQHGWSIEKAVTTPPRADRRRKPASI